MERQQLTALWQNFTVSKKKQAYLILLLMMVSSLLEVISLGSLFPFIGALTSPEVVYGHELMQPVVRLLSITSAEQLFFPLTIIFIVVTVFATTVRLLLLYIMTRFSFETGGDLSVNIYQRALYQEYKVHIDRNSSVVISGIISKTGKVSGVILNILTLVSSAFVIIGIMSVLFAINVSIALVSFFLFSFLYWIVIYLTKGRVKENSECIAYHSTQVVKSLQEGLGSIRDVLINSSQKFYCKLYKDSDIPLRKAAANNMFISGSPRFILESLSIIIIVLLAFSFVQDENKIINLIPVLGVLALGAQRLLPALQQAYASYSSIKGAQSSMRDVLSLLSQPLPDYIDQHQIPILFKDKISINNLSFRYNYKGPDVLKNIDLIIHKGSRIGFIGETGSGKITLIDIIIGLLEPTVGDVVVDGKVIDKKNYQAWKSRIAHVPQNIHLSDSTIQENIAFGVHSKNIDHAYLEKAAEQAQISELINSWEDGYKTFIGEHGARLSGGQRQRIAIARALYKKADILIFDEATSSLDSETEKSIIKAIEGLNKDLTILVIAHRVSTLSMCDKVIELKDGSILKSGTYEEMIGYKLRG